jgi:protein gp37
MGDKSNIEWTDATWNPVTGCTKISPGCKNCYAERLAHRLKAMGNPRYRRGFEVTLHWDQLNVPLKWRKPRLVFVNSMSDIFHEDIPEDFVRRSFDVMGLAKQHLFQVLTKRPDRLAMFADRLTWHDNVWLGVSIESQKYVWRAKILRQIPSKVRFLSLEPLIGPISGLNLRGIHWVIVGGESGPHHRLVEIDWVRRIRDLCVDAGVPFFFKQWGGRTPKARGRQLDGQTWGEMPEATNLLTSSPGRGHGRTKSNSLAVRSAY